MRTRSSPSSSGAGTSSPRAASAARRWRAGGSSGGCSPPEAVPTIDVLPELFTARLTVRLARPGMERAMARFLRENFPGHLDRWSPPAPPGFFSESFWAERLAVALAEYGSDRAVRFVFQRPGTLEAPVVGTANYTN